MSRSRKRPFGASEHKLLGAEPRPQVSPSGERWVPELDLVFGQLRPEVATTPLEGIGAPACLLVGRVLATAVRRCRHRERVLPARHVHLQLGGRHLALGSKAFGHLFIEPDRAAAAPLQAVLGDASAKVGRTLANGFEGRVVADSATVTHRERVLPGRK